MTNSCLGERESFSKEICFLSLTNFRITKNERENEHHEHVAGKPSAKSKVFRALHFQRVERRVKKEVCILLLLHTS